AGSELPDQSIVDGDASAEAEAREEPEEDEHAGGGSESTGDREDREHEEGDGECIVPTDDIGDAAPDEGSQGHADDIRRRDPRRLADAEVPIVAEQRNEEPVECDVPSVEHESQSADDEYGTLGAPLPWQMGDDFGGCRYRRRGGGGHRDTLTHLTHCCANVAGGPLPHLRISVRQRVTTSRRIPATAGSPTGRRAPAEGAAPRPGESPRLRAAMWPGEPRPPGEPEPPSETPPSNPLTGQSDPETLEGGCRDRDGGTRLVTRAGWASGASRQSSPQARRTSQPFSSSARPYWMSSSVLRSSMVFCPASSP